MDLTAYVEKHEFCFDAVLDEHVTNDEVAFLSFLEFGDDSHFPAPLRVRLVNLAHEAFVHKTHRCRNIDLSIGELINEKEGLLCCCFSTIITLRVHNSCLIFLHILHI